MCRQPDAMKDTRPHFLCFRWMPLLAPADAVGRHGDAIAQARVRKRLVRVRIADLIQVLQSELHRVHTDRVRRLLHGRFQGEGAVRMHHAPIGKRDVVVGHHVDAFERQVRDFVRVVHGEPGARCRRELRRADVGDHLEVARHQRPVAVDAQLHLIAEARPVTACGGIFITRLERLHWPAGDLRHHRRVHVVDLRQRTEAVARAHVPRVQPAHLVERDIEPGGHAGAVAERTLIGVVDSEPVAVPPHHAIGELERRVRLDRLDRDLIHHHFGGAERGIALTADQRRGDDGGRAVQLAVELSGRARLHTLQEVDDRRQYLVIDLDLADRFVSDLRRFGAHHGHHHAGLEDLFGEQEAVRRAKAHLDVQVLARRIEAVQHRHHTGRLFRLARVHRLDPRVRVRAAQRLQVDLIGDVHVLDIIAEPGHHPVALGAHAWLADDLQVGRRQLRARVRHHGYLIRLTVHGGVLLSDGLRHFRSGHVQGHKLFAGEERRPLLHRQLARVGRVGRDPQQIHIDWHMCSPTT